VFLGITLAYDISKPVGNSKLEFGIDATTKDNKDNNIAYIPPLQEREYNPGFWIHRVRRCCKK
jgi:hypothetical protein